MTFHLLNERNVIRCTECWHTHTLNDIQAVIDFRKLHVFAEHQSIWQTESVPLSSRLSISLPTVTDEWNFITKCWKVEGSRVWWHNLSLQLQLQTSKQLIVKQLTLATSFLNLMYASKTDFPQEPHVRSKVWRDRGANGYHAAEWMLLWDVHSIIHTNTMSPKLISSRTHCNLTATSKGLEEESLSCFKWFQSWPQSGQNRGECGRNSVEYSYTVFKCHPALFPNVFNFCKALLTALY